MDEIQTETITVQSDSMFCFDLAHQEDQEGNEYEDDSESEENTTEPVQLIAKSSCYAVPRPSILEATPGLPPFQLDQEALFRELIAQHQRRLYRFVIKYIDHPDDAADITQQAFVEAARTIASFRGDSKLSTWLFGIAMNMVRNYLSRAPHRVHKFETDESLLSVASSELDPSDSFSQRELLILAEKAFCDLPSEMSEVLGLVAVDEISYQDAADMLAIPLGTVRSRVSRARAVLRAQFEQAGVKLQF